MSHVETDAAEAVAAPGALLRAIITWLCIAGLLAGAMAAAWGSLSREVYGAGAFVREYLEALARHDAAAALALPGVSPDSAALGEMDLPLDSSEALLRREALGSLQDIRFISDAKQDDGSHTVTFGYTASGKPGKSTFDIASGPRTFGVFPSWRFERSPLSAVRLTVLHATQFRANGFRLDTRQVAPAGQEPAFTNTVSLLAFTPSTIDFDLELRMLAAPKQTVSTRQPGEVVEASVDASPTDAFVTEVQQQIDAYLDQCATQVVLQPTGCPFGQIVKDRVQGAPVWSIAEHPVVEIQPGESSWQMPSTVASAHIVVTVQSLFDGSVSTLDQDVPFTLSAFVTVRDDGSLYIDLR